MHLVNEPGWRLLGDDEILQADDETAEKFDSMLTTGEGWRRIADTPWRVHVGMTVKECADRREVRNWGFIHRRKCDT